MDRNYHCGPSSTELKDIIFYPLKPKGKVYDKEVLTNYPGDLFGTIPLITGLPLMRSANAI